MIPGYLVCNQERVYWQGFSQLYQRIVTASQEVAEKNSEQSAMGTVSLHFKA
jgi:hypothetical protein